MSRIVIDFAGAPVAKGRPKFARVGRGEGAFNVAYTPDKTKKYEAALRYAAQEAMAGRPPLSCPLAIEISAFVQIPQSWSGKKKREALDGRLAPTKRPDIDNYIKIVADALNTVVFVDDSQIVELIAHKSYSDRPGMWIAVDPLTVLQKTLEAEAA